MHMFDYSNLQDRTWDGEILSYIAQIHEYKDRQEQQTVDASELVRMHLVLAQQLGETNEEEIYALAISEELRKQILSEKQLLAVFANKGEQEMVTLLTTFTCFLRSQENGEPMHSRKYMEDVKRLHEVVNIYYGVDPGAARSCS